MKWYFAINEAGAAAGLGLHARLAVLSALRAGGLAPHLLYLGKRGAFTDWMAAHDVAIIDYAPTFLPAFEAAVRAGRHPAGFAGHWLRTGICLIEQEQEFVLYTDCDVVFRRAPDLDAIRPDFIACGPEFRPDRWDYFNSGVMVMNVPALRRDYRQFETFIIDALASPEQGHFDDQRAYNEFYQGRWMRLDPALNWKPYWGFHDRAVITHYHGPKLDNLRLILDGGCCWNDEHSRMLGSMFVAALPSYIAHLRDLLAVSGNSDEQLHSLVEELLADAEKLYRVAPMDRIDLSFMAA